MSNKIFRLSFSGGCLVGAAVLMLSLGGTLAAANAAGNSGGRGGGGSRGQGGGGGSSHSFSGGGSSSRSFSGGGNSSRSFSGGSGGKSSQSFSGGSGGNSSQSFSGGSGGNSSRSFSGGSGGKSSHSFSGGSGGNSSRSFSGGSFSSGSIDKHGSGFSGGSIDRHGSGFSGGSNTKKFVPNQDVKHFESDFHKGGRPGGDFHKGGSAGGSPMHSQFNAGRYLGPSGHHNVPHDWDRHFSAHNWGRDWDHYYHDHHYYPNYFGFGPFWWDFGFYYPWRPYVYTYDVYPYDGYVYQYDVVDASPVVAVNPSTAVDSGVSVTAAYPPEPEEDTADDSDSNALQYYSGAREAFRKEDYRNALRLANHAAIEAPQNAKVHELMSLALLGLADYRGAATEAHAALAFGPAIDWTTLQSYYSSAEKYTNQLRKLEKFVADNPTSAPARFLLGYQYIMTGYRAEAKRELTEAVKLTPKDKLATHLLQQLETDQPITPPAIESKSAKEM